MRKHLSTIILGIVLLAGLSLLLYPTISDYWNSYHQSKAIAGYVQAVDIIEDGKFETIKITLKYGADKNEKIITGLKRISKPGLRVYASKDELPRVLGGLGTAIISTNKGVLTDKEARKQNVGGEVLAFVW